MAITITLNRFEGCKTPLCTETLEELEDKLRQLLINECFDDFTIEDSYTGNELSSYIDPEDKGPGDVSYDEEGFVIEEDIKRLQPELERQAELVFKCTVCGVEWLDDPEFASAGKGNVVRSLCEECRKEGYALTATDTGKIIATKGGEQEQEELDAIERPFSQARVEACCESTETMMEDAQQPLANIRAEVRKAHEEDIYECEYCNEEFKESEIILRDYGGEIGTIAFCPHCKQATKLICVTDLVEARK